MELALGICAMIAIVSGLSVMYFAQTKGDKHGLIALGIAVVFGVTAILLYLKINQRQAANDDVVRQSTAIQAMIDDLQWKDRTGSKYQEGADWELVCTDREDLSAQSPWVAIQVRPDDETARPVFDKFIAFSEGKKLSPEALEACRTVVFCVSSYWDTARYSTSYYHNFLGTSERKRLYLYDVEAGAIFAEGELKAAALPKSADKEPHNTVSSGSVRKWIRRQLEGGESE